MKKIADKIIIEAVKRALAEDLGTGDITGEYTDFDVSSVVAQCCAREDLVLCGVDVAKVVFNLVDPAVKFKALAKDGAKLKSGQLIYEVKGNAESIVCAERVSLNFIGYLSGIASQSFELQEKVRKYGVTLLDTRKTTPTLRLFEKYAVRCGGATNHRMGLYDMFLIKENHLFSAGIKCRKNIDERKLRGLVKHMKKETHLKVEIEADNMREFKAALKSGCDRIMLDNFTPAQIRKAIAIRDIQKPKMKLEASGGINPKNLLSYAKTGVDFISLGALTHSTRFSDVSLTVGTQNIASS